MAFACLQTPQMLQILAHAFPGQLSQPQAAAIHFYRCSRLLFARATLAGPQTFKRSKCFRRPFHGNSRSHRLQPSVFNGVRACRLPGRKHSKCLRGPFHGNSHSHRLQPQPSVFTGFRACRLPAANARNASASLSTATLAATGSSHLFLPVFEPAVCRPANTRNASASLSTATESRHRLQHRVARGMWHHIPRGKRG